MSADTTPLTIEVALRCALLVAGALVFFTGIDNYAYAVWSGPKPLYYVVVFVAAAAGLLLTSAGRPMALWRSPLLAWLLAFFVITTAWALWMRPSTQVTQILFDRYRSMASLLAFAVVVDDPRTRRVGVHAVAAAVVLAALLNVGESLGLLLFAEPASLGRVAGRSAGFFINPNGVGLAIALGLSIAIVRVPWGWRVPLLLVGVLGVATTFSRSAAICLAVLILWLARRREIGASALLVFVATFVILVAYRGDLIPFLVSRGVLNDNTWAHLHFEGDSGRTEVALKALRLFLDSPFLGHGLGSTFDWNAEVSSHNMYLNLAGDHGILGLLLLPALGAAVVAADRRSAPFALVLLVAGLFSHDLLDNRATLLAIALAAATGAHFAPARDVGAPGQLSDRRQ